MMHTYNHPLPHTKSTLGDNSTRDDQYGQPQNGSRTVCAVLDDLPSRCYSCSLGVSGVSVSWPSSDLPGHSDWRWTPTGAVNSHELHFGPSRLGKSSLSPCFCHLYCVILCHTNTMSFLDYFGVYKEMAITKVSHMMGLLGSHLWTNFDA